ncbi:ser thr protein phosphatase family [Phlyctema vagabunda]|uniref:Ser thr protein phosphatase family n=1 Tax=Phlyctema vagabunda TaxID=108571 RepID=A0ABR4PGI1_9HELO
MPRLEQSSMMAQTTKSRPRLSFYVYAIALLMIIWTTWFITGLGNTRGASGGDAALVEGQDRAATEQIPEQYIGAATPAFADMTQLMDLPASYVPETGKHRKDGRLVIVGDVHGMKESLEKLLKKIKFDKKHDHLVLAGDMISKGPDSPGVVDLAIDLGATGVRGNHEDRVLLVHADMETNHVDMKTPSPAEDPEKEEDALEELSYSHGDYKDRALVRALGKKRIQWLKKCPVILRVGDCGSMGEVVVVHAGLAPGVELKRQDPAMVMNMRTINHDGVPSDGRKGKAWQKAWNKYQKHLPSKKRSTVVYGHDSKRGLQLEKYSMGIDTSCLKGGKLSAMVIEGANSDYKHKIVSVKCPDGRSGR